MKGSLQIPARTALWLPLALSLALMATLFALVEPIWETNDDVAMSMVAHGYGLAAYGTSMITFSNVFWGRFIRAIPEIGGVLGYSIASYGALMAAGTAAGSALRTVGWPITATAMFLVLALSRPIVFPQFTVNAGLLAAAAVALALAHHRTGRRTILVAACALFLTSFVVRSLECALVLAVLLPVLPYRWFRRGDVQIAVLLTLICAGAMLLFDSYIYKGGGWDYFRELNGPRAAFTDFGALDSVLAQPDLLARHSFSENDLRLIANWFFADKALIEPGRLSRLLADAGFQQNQRFDPELAWTTLENLLSDKMYPLVATALVLPLLAFRWRLLLSLLLCASVIAVLGSFGRHNIDRVHVPLLLGLMLASMMALSEAGRVRRNVAAGIVLLAMIASLVSLYDDAFENRERIRWADESVADLPQPLAIWGASFPFEVVYRPFQTNPAIRGVALRPLGAFFHAPFSVESVEAAKGRSMMTELAGDGIWIVAAPSLLADLETYARERGRRLEIIASDDRLALPSVKRVRLTSP